MHVLPFPSIRNFTDADCKHSDRRKSIGPVFFPTVCCGVIFKRCALQRSVYYRFGVVVLRRSVGDDKITVKRDGERNVRIKIHFDACNYVSAVVGLIVAILQRDGKFAVLCRVVCLILIGIFHAYPVCRSVKAVPAGIWNPCSGFCFTDLNNALRYFSSLNMNVAETRTLISPMTALRNTSGQAARGSQRRSKKCAIKI